MLVLSSSRCSELLGLFTFSQTFRGSTEAAASLTLLFVTPVYRPNA